MNKANFYVTTPIYYVNDSPHIGHAYTTILADVLARFHRRRGRRSFFLTGTDEHGQKVARAAEAAGLTPQQQADSTVTRFKTLWSNLNISYDDFIRTTEKRHAAVVRSALQQLYDKGEIYKADYDGWYCVPCERFFTEKESEEAKCAECGRPLDRISESNYFFKMSAYQEWLIAYIRDNPDFIQPEFRRNETLGFLRKPLNDLCISRPKSRLTWGIELPFDSQFVTYVWFDALLNYISAIGYGSDPERFHSWWPASCQLIGKDILTTHTVYWPTMLKAMGLPLPKTVFAHGWWLLGESKMSKSSGNVVDPMAVAERYGADAFRYFLMAEMTAGQDCGFSEELFIRRYNADLANDLGNLLSRVMKLAETHCDGRVPHPGEPGSEEVSLQQAAAEAARAFNENMEKLNINIALASAISLVRKANRYLEQRQPWTLAKESDKTPLQTVLYHAFEILRITSSLLRPIMPGKMTELLASIGLPATQPNSDDSDLWGRLRPGAELGSLISLFPRVKTPEVQPPALSSTKDKLEHVDFADFEKLRLKTAKILEAEQVEGADKLLKLVIEVGSEKRQIVAGIALHYKPEDLLGKTIIIVANLKPVTIRGVASNGMLLAASSGKNLRLLTIDGEFPSGAQVK